MKIPDFESLIHAVTDATKIVESSFGKPIESTLKEDGTPVTPIDIQVNQELLEWSSKYPDLGFMGEEGNGIVDKPYILLVDPLDGTEVFRRGIATCTCIATIMRMKNGDGTPCMSVIRNPITHETWCAVAGDGAIKLHTGTRTRILKVHEVSLPEDRIRTAICAWPGASHKLESISSLIKYNYTFIDQPMGALGIGGALIAQGTLDATVCGKGSAAEVAAMALLVQEAGGVSLDLKGNRMSSFPIGLWKGKDDFLLPNGAVMATNREVANSLLKFIHQNQ